MKRLILAVGMVVGAVGLSHAESYGMFGQMDGHGIHKSTVMVTNQVNMPISTGNIIIVGYHVLSTGVTSGLIFQEMTTVGANFATPSFYGSSQPYNGAGVARYPADNWTDEYGFMTLIKSTMGWCVTKQGNPPATVEIDWDYWK